MKGGAEPPTVYLHDFDGNLAAEADGDTGSILTEHVYNGASRLAMADHATGAVYFFHNDQLGTPELMSDSTNTAVWEAAYDAFGEAAVNPASTVTNNFRFPGQYYDAETGLHYNRHRYYDPKTGRYLTPDPIGLAGGINPYVYANGDPVNLIDPFGLAIGDFPPPPPGYDPGKWVHGQWSNNGRYWLEDPNGVKWTAHPEDETHWRHWDKQGPGGDNQGRWPSNSKKPWPNQKRFKKDQCFSDPSGDAEPYKPWAPSPSEYMPSGFLLPIPGFMPGTSGSPFGTPIRTPLILRPILVP